MDPHSEHWPSASTAPAASAVPLSPNDSAEPAPHPIPPLATRWSARPPAWLRALAGVTGPALVAMNWGACWTWVSTWPATPRGDDWFTWSPMALVLVAPAALLGLCALIPRTLRLSAMVACSAWLLAALPLFLLVPRYGEQDAFPSSGLPLMMVGLALSSLPFVALLLWPRRATWVALLLTAVVGAVSAFVVKDCSPHEVCKHLPGHAALATFAVQFNAPA